MFWNHSIVADLFAVSEFVYNRDDDIWTWFMECDFQRSSTNGNLVKVAGFSLL